MSDFDAALERLISDPAFREALAADPARALAGYQLSPDELDILTSQVDTGTGGGQRQVEQRTSKASLFGLLSPMGGIAGFGAGLADSPDGAAASFGAQSPGAGRRRTVAGQLRVGAVGGELRLRDAPGRASARSSRERASEPHRTAAEAYGRGFGAALGSAGDFVIDGGVEEPAGPVYDSTGQVYQTRVDANGDGRWDEFTTIDRGGQGVDLAVDRDHDGRVDWVGHDFDRDGLIDEASVDHDNDGTLETRWVDSDGDGWLDTRLPAQPAPDSESARIEPRDDSASRRGTLWGASAAPVSLPLSPSPTTAGSSGDERIRVLRGP